MIDPELDELKREFLAEAEVKIREMQEALDGKTSAESWQRVAYLAHQLKGSGGSYGYERISADAAEVEKAVETIGKEQNDRLEEKIQQHVLNLKLEVERRTRELSGVRA